MVSVSSPSATAAAMPARKVSVGPSADAACSTACSAAKSAVTVNPLGDSEAGAPERQVPSASAAHASRRPAGSSSRPCSGRPRTPPTTERLIASHQSTQESPASGSACVSSAMDRAARAMRPGSSGKARATGAVRISAPLPPVRPERACSSAATAVIRTARPGWPSSLCSALSTWRVWVPTSLAPPCSQSRNSWAIASSPSGASIGTSEAATRAMHIAIWVSSDHSPGAYGPSPPPLISGPRRGSYGAEANSYGTPAASPQARPSRAPAARSAAVVVVVMGER